MPAMFELLRHHNGGAGAELGHDLGGSVQNVPC